MTTMVMLNTLENRFSGYMGPLWAIYNATDVGIYPLNGPNELVLRF